MIVPFYAVKQWKSGKEKNMKENENIVGQENVEQEEGLEYDMDVNPTTEEIAAAETMDEEED